MPRSERRRWWMERDVSGWVLVLDGDPVYMPGSVDEEQPAGRGAIALWRLVQWLRIRLGDSRWMLSEELAHSQWLSGELRDADAAVLDARCREEQMRVECEGYDNAALQEQVGDLAWQLAQATNDRDRHHAAAIEARTEAATLHALIQNLRTDLALSRESHVPCSFCGSIAYGPEVGAGCPVCELHGVKRELDVAHRHADASEKCAKLNGKRCLELEAKCRAYEAVAQFQPEASGTAPLPVGANEAPPRVDHDVDCGKRVNPADAEKP